MGRGEGDEQPYENSKECRCRDAFSLPASQKIFCFLPASVQHEGCLPSEWLSNLQRLPQRHVIDTENPEAVWVITQACRFICLSLAFFFCLSFFELEAINSSLSVV